MNRCAGVLVATFLVAVCNFVPGCSKGESLPDRTRKLYSQGDEELIIREFFDDRRGGFFVDVGSYHWKELSTTYFLEKHLGWSGIAIDAQSEFAEGYRKFRPRTRFFSYAVTDRSGETLSLYLAWGLSSLDADWLKKAQGKDVKQRTVDVTTITLDDLLAKNQVSKIDFLSMDIEGAEPAALAGFDIEKYRPELVCIESGVDNRDTLLTYFDEHGYERINEEGDPVNWYFRPKSPRG